MSVYTEEQEVVATQQAELPVDHPVAQYLARLEEIKKAVKSGKPASSVWEQNAAGHE